MSRATNVLRIAACALLGAAALGCKEDKPKPIIDRLTEASECGFPIDGGVSFEGELHDYELHAECGEGDPCEQDTPYVQGSAVLVGVELDELRSELFFADVIAGDEPKEVRNISVLRDPCSEKPKVLAIVFLDAAGAQTLELSDDEGVIERFELLASPVAAVEVALENEAGELEPIEMLDLGEDAVVLRATPSDADGTTLNALDQAVWWIEDTSVAAFGESSATNMEGLTAELVPVAEGDTVLHVLIANVEVLLDVHVTL